ncbi:MAG: trans-aconitate 2-methyltransferase [Candidatus Binatia bacterium]
MSNTWETILQQTAAYYTAKIQEHGATARGVDWNSTESQSMRFQQLLRLCLDTSRPFSINDIGCGYGALVDYLQACHYRFSYAGVDLSTAMIQVATERYLHDSRCQFFTTFSALPVADYSVASGIFNVKLSTPDGEWITYMAAMLDQLASVSSLGFAFNVLTQYSDAERQRPDLYYADPRFWFDHCQQRYSRWVALLHDYGLYEFTILVRREGGKAWPSSSCSVPVISRA